MLENGPGNKDSPEIPFCDETTETADTIRIFLELSGAQLSAESFDNGALKIVQAIPFLHKYECKWAIRLLALQTETNFQRGRLGAREAFIIATLIDSHGLAESVIRQSGTGPIGFDEYKGYTITCDKCGCQRSTGKVIATACRVLWKRNCDCFFHTGLQPTVARQFASLPKDYLSALIIANREVTFGATFSTASKTFAETLRTVRAPAVGISQFLC